MSTLDKTEKRRFAKNLHGVGTAATIRETVVKDLRESCVLVCCIDYILPVLSAVYTFVSIVGGVGPFSMDTFEKRELKFYE